MNLFSEPLLSITIGVLLAIGLWLIWRLGKVEGRLDNANERCKALESGYAERTHDLIEVLKKR